MEQLVININPFILTQNYFVIKDNKITETGNFQLKNINNIVFSHKNLEKVTFCGNKNFITKFLESITLFSLNVKNSNTAISIQKHDLQPESIEFIAFHKKEAVFCKTASNGFIYESTGSYSIFVPHSGQNLGILPSAGL